MNEKRGSDRATDADFEPMPAYHIAATGQSQERRPRTIKHGRTFAQFDHYGDIVRDELNPEGVFFNDTRFLSRFELLLNNARPLLLSSSVQHGGATLMADLANPDSFVDGHLILPRDVIHIRRSKYLWGAACHERIEIYNFDVVAHRLTLGLVFDSDFSDIFEARGQQRARRGRLTADVDAAHVVHYRYVALDGVALETRLRFEPAPDRLAVGRADYQLTLAPQARWACFLDMRFDGEAPTESPRGCFFLNMREGQRWRRAERERAAVVASTDTLLNEVIERATSDLYMLITDTGHGPFPFAGIPWFNTVFGRDGLITALLTQWIDPEIGRGVLMTLAAHQATEIDSHNDAEPGKILHEMRAGEMARLGEVPFGKYYGSADSTPLFVMLAGEYLARTGDTQTIAALWPNIEAALVWIDDYGDRDGDGFVEYGAPGGDGLVNQGWKDSHDSVFHADGSLATGPIALCEVQGYVYAARQHGATIARAMDRHALASSLEAAAQDLRSRFTEAYWCEELSTFALALDGDKRPCRVRTSNPGHLLYCGIVEPEHAMRVADTLLDHNGFSGWGVRTVSAIERRYNPVSYHNGSIWPHDNALIALGLDRYGMKPQAQRVFQGLFDATSHIDQRRLPELFCGFTRQPTGNPTFYPTACSPQAWASASLLGMLRALLGVSFDRTAGEIRFNRPVLPTFVEELYLSRLEFGGGEIDVVLRAHDGDVAVSVTRRTADVTVVTSH